MLLGYELDVRTLSPTDRLAVQRLAGAAQAADGVAPLGEQVLLRLDDDDLARTHVVVMAGGTNDLAGYAQIDREISPSSAEIVVHPAHRRRRIGTTLLRTAMRDATLPTRSGEPGDHGGLRIWAHGNLPAAQAFAASAGLAVVRELLVLHRPLPVSPSGMKIPGIALASFRPGIDDAVWVSANAAAFSGHPEQGRLTIEDLHDRMRQPWFDRDGLILAWSDSVGAGGTSGGDLVGFVWTKIDPAADRSRQPRPDAQRPEGEIYALGVIPQWQGKGIGNLLLEAGMAHLGARGASRVFLYVDGDNTPALRTYERSGFARRSVDVQYGAA